MSTLKVIFDFLLSVVKIIFPGKNNGRHCHPDHPVPDRHHPDSPDPEGDGSGDGGSGSHPVDVAEIPPDECIDAADFTDRLMGHAMIATAIIGYLYKMYLS